MTMHQQDINPRRDGYVAGRDLHLHLPAQQLSLYPEERFTTPLTYDRARPIFLQYLNPEIRSCYGRPPTARFTETDLSQALHATRLAVLATDEELVLPASYLFEVPVLSVFLTRIRPLVVRGVVHYSSHIADLDSYVEHKAVEYRGDARNPYDLTPHRRLIDGLVWRPRYAQNTASDIAQSWRDALDSHGQLASTLVSVSRRWPDRAGDVETHLREVPERLEGQAFVGRFVRATVPVPLEAEERSRVDMFLSRQYLASYLRDLDAAIVADFDFGDFSCGIRQLRSSLADRVLSARAFDLGLSWLGIHDLVHHGTRWRDLLSLRATPEFGAIATATQHPVLRARLREAVIRGRKQIRFQNATTIPQAHTVVSVVANRLDVALNQTDPDRRTR
ncbi:hypothetical protein D7147_08100 [Micromonospora musae]|uniref:Uncharacterized protein n=1 Tax=Micromonospora musae TaxID=1894970 RepID=A0ABX9RGT0_9ACTN|nr:hypothetical protein [Micromonospora musae]RKN22597.1 hypothetical protein D7147_08100 [Micromonospora musae]